MNIRVCTKCKKGKELVKNFSFYAARGRYASECSQCHRDASNQRNRFNRLRVLTYYGGDPPKCACCGETFLEFLSLDHINGGGRKQRQVIKVRWWEWIIKNNFPPGFRVLCHNCNQSIGLYGYCPHSKGPLLVEECRAYDPTKPNKGYKLNPIVVAEIRNLLAEGWAQSKVAEKYNVSRATICLINGGKRWAN